MSDQWLTYLQAGRLCGVTSETIRRARERGDPAWVDQGATAAPTMSVPSPLAWI